MTGKNAGKKPWEGLEIEISGPGALRAAAALDLGGRAIRQAQQLDRGTKKKRTIDDMLREAGFNGR